VTSRIERVAVIGADAIGRIACSAGCLATCAIRSYLIETRQNKKTALGTEDKLADRVCL
jgi:folate-dependent tRNA-U54 methylase TrmFO/GidA